MQKGTGGVKYILLAVDYTTRFVVVQAAITADGTAMQKFLKECIIQRYGWMKWLDEEIGYGSRDAIQITVISGVLQKISN